MDFKHYVKEINIASKQGKLVFFIGAGVSKLSGFPTWNDLINEFYRQLYGKENNNTYSNNDYLKIPQMYYDSLDSDKKSKYDQVLENVFKISALPNPVHFKLLSLNPVHIITTNYDNLIEETCWQRGKYYTKISAEKDVSGAISSRYLIKVHGDFSEGYKAENVVLKEDDYINYDRSFPLISNLMKTIIATHTIVFVGYGLADYNINLILNWVKQVQKDVYNKPFFIRTDPKPIEEVDIRYYENKGLRIIDALDAMEIKSDNYEELYNSVIDKLIHSRDNLTDMSEEEAVNYIYDKILPLTQLKYIRKLDFKYVFDEDYKFSVDGLITNMRFTGPNYMERFFGITGSSPLHDIHEIRDKYKEVMGFFHKYSIYGMVGSTEIADIYLDNSVYNPVFNSDYNVVNELIRCQTEDIELLYNKSFYLAVIGEWEESYDMYTNVISLAISSKKLWIHFLAQINRFHLYQSIIQAKKYFGFQGVLSYGKRFTLFSVDFLSKIERELKFFNLKDLFQSLPIEFQDDYKILEFLCDNNFLYDDIVKLFEQTNKIKSSISKGSVSLGGLTTETIVEIKANETIKFLYENHMWSSSFIEYKSYVKSAMMSLLEKAAYDSIREPDALGLTELFTQSSYVIGYFEYVNLSKCCTIEDLRYIENEYDLENIQFNESEKIQEYLERLTSVLGNGLNEIDINVLFLNYIITEIKSAIYLAKYVSLSNECQTSLVNCIINCIPNRELDNGKKYVWCSRLFSKNNMSQGALKLIEEFILVESQKHEDISYNELSSNGRGAKNFSGLINYFYPDYRSEIISNYVLSAEISSNKLINYLYSVNKILNKEAKELLFRKKTIITLEDIFQCYHSGDIENLNDYGEVILQHISKEMEVIRNSDLSKRNTFGNNKYAVEIASKFFCGEFNSEKLKDYKGVIDEYDMFIDPNEFDYSKFKPYWLKKYSESLLTEISRNEVMRVNISKNIKQQLKDSKDYKYLNILLKHFI